MTPIGQGSDGVGLLEAVVYPRPEYRGRPWTAWGQGVVIGDGRFFSAIGDHLGAEGNSYVYEFDPSSGTLTEIGDVRQLVGPTTWGYGKVHGQMVSGPCGEVYFSTYWGDKPGGETLDAYEGDFLLRIDPESDQIEALGSPVPGYGVPSLAGATGLGLVYGEAVDPAIEPKDGPFFAYDVAAEAVVYASPEADDHQGFRNIAVDRSGKAYFSGADYRLLVFDPATNQVTDYPGQLPGKWLRASTQPAPDGTIYAATREPDMLFSFTPEGTVTTLGPAPDYVASLAMHPDGTRFFYIPSAHGKSWQLGAPLMEVNIATGEQRVLVELNPLGESELGLSFGGTYGIVADPGGERLYVVMNSGVPENVRDAAFGEVVLVVVHLV
ncbi:MAG TPA: hypothetical protein VJ815_03030 [Acidimicrobiia bacterium]|nr:hypothetical protein [Acidimicrobiia bacterium]